MQSLDFVKSSYSSTAGECVEVARNLAHRVAVRDSKSPDGPVVRLAPDAWAKFTESLNWPAIDVRLLRFPEKHRIDPPVRREPH
ncbi:DUF397 domain-containing protein [Streptomyces sp. NPDC047000]|uniref:DUF397 domain-containing protein n=1 Tax=Streptomyces sp. NPDC047000 TaxID=3155474 RepID=UPI0033E159E1